jgi:hypothetical protein
MHGIQRKGICFVGQLKGGNCRYSAKYIFALSLPDINLQIALCKMVASDNELTKPKLVLNSCVISRVTSPKNLIK